MQIRTIGSVLLLLLVAVVYSSCANKHLMMNRVNDRSEKVGYWCTYTDSTGWVENIRYRRGVEHGVYSSYNIGGGGMSVGRYRNGKRFGTWYFYDTQRAHISWRKYRKGEVHSQLIINPRW